MSTAANTRAWQIQIHDCIALLERHWRALEDSGCCTLFQTYDWLFVWYDVTSRHGVAEPVIVTATREGRQAPDVIFPLCRLKHRHYREIAFADILVSDFAAPVFASDALQEPGTMRTLWSEVLKALPKSDIVHLDKLCTTVGGQANPLLELRGAMECQVGLWGVPLSDEQGDGLPMSIDKDVLKKTAKRQERMSREHDRGYEWIEEPEGQSALFETLVSLRLKRFDLLNREELLEDKVWLDFYRTMVARSHGSIAPVIGKLSADGETVAAALGFIHGGTFHYILPSFLVGNWNRHALGLQLLFEMMRDCRRRRMTYFDLTIGDEPYKHSIGATRRVIYEAVVPRTATGWIIYAMWRLKHAILQRPSVAAIARAIVRTAKRMTMPDSKRVRSSYRKVTGPRASGP